MAWIRNRSVTLNVGSFQFIANRSKKHKLVYSKNSSGTNDYQEHVCEDQTAQHRMSTSKILSLIEPADTVYRNMVGHIRSQSKLKINRP